jgi:hypothetical protein
VCHEDVTRATSYQHTFTSPYPFTVAGLVKKMAVSGYAKNPPFLFY